MSDNVYKIVEIVGSSTTSIEDAVNNAIAESAEELRHLRWCQVTETRGHIENGVVAHWQVSVKIGFTMETQG